jgi:hypothetical protein
MKEHTVVGSSIEGNLFRYELNVGSDFFLQRQDTYVTFRIDCISRVCIEEALVQDSLCPAADLTLGSSIKSLGIAQGVMIVGHIYVLLPPKIENKDFSIQGHSCARIVESRVAKKSDYGYRTNW